MKFPDEDFCLFLLQGFEVMLLIIDFFLEPNDFIQYKREFWLQSRAIAFSTVTGKQEFQTKSTPIRLT